MFSEKSIAENVYFVCTSISGRWLVKLLSFVAILKNIFIENSNFMQNFCSEIKFLRELETCLLKIKIIFQNLNIENRLFFTNIF